MFGVLQGRPPTRAIDYLRLPTWCPPLSVSGSEDKEQHLGTAEGLQGAHGGAKQATKQRARSRGQDVGTSLAGGHKRRLAQRVGVQHRLKVTQDVQLASCPTMQREVGSWRPSPVRHHACSKGGRKASGAVRISWIPVPECSCTVTVLLPPTTHTRLPRESRGGPANAQPREGSVVLQWVPGQAAKLVVLCAVTDSCKSASHSRARVTSLAGVHLVRQRRKALPSGVRGVFDVPPPPAQASLAGIGARRHVLRPSCQCAYGAVGKARRGHPAWRQAPLAPLRRRLQVALGPRGKVNRPNGGIPEGGLARAAVGEEELAVVGKGNVACELAPDPRALSRLQVGKGSHHRLVLRCSNGERVCIGVQGGARRGSGGSCEPGCGGHCAKAVRLRRHPASGARVVFTVHLVNVRQSLQAYAVI